MNLCPPGCLCLVHSLCIVWWKPGCPCMAVCLCPSHLISVATPCSECVHASVHEFMSTLHPMSGPPLWIVTWKVGCPCVSLHVCPSHLILVATPCLECVHASVHELCPPGCLCLVHYLCIVWWKSWHLCMVVCLCPSHLISFATPCSECVHASVHEFMSTLHPMSGPPHINSYMESWVPLCVTSCVSHLPWLWSYTYIECVYASVHEFMSTWLLMSGAPPMQSFMETLAPLYGRVFVSQLSYFYWHTLFRMCTCISTWIYVYLTLHVWSTPYG